MCECGYESKWTATRAAAKRAGTGHRRSLEPVRRAAWLTKPCPTWCIAEHHASDVPNERRHISQWFTIERPGMALVYDRRQWRFRRTGVRLEAWANVFSNRSPWMRYRTENERRQVRT